MRVLVTDTPDFGTSERMTVAVGLSPQRPTSRWSWKEQSGESEARPRGLGLRARSLFPPARPWLPLWETLPNTYKFHVWRFELSKEWVVLLSETYLHLKFPKGTSLVRGTRTGFWDLVRSRCG